LSAQRCRLSAAGSQLLAPSGQRGRVAW
jgi:hypothetical protein